MLTNTIKCQNWILAVRVELFCIFLSIMHISLAAESRVLSQLNHLHAPWWITVQLFVTTKSKARTHTFGSKSWLMWKSWLEQIISSSALSYVKRFECNERELESKGTKVHKILEFWCSNTRFKIQKTFHPIVRDNCEFAYSVTIHQNFLKHNHLTYQRTSNPSCASFKDGFWQKTIMNSTQYEFSAFIIV